MKKLIFGLIATVFIGVFSSNAQNGFQPIDFGFNKILPTRGDCMTGSAFCVTSIDIPINFDTSMVAMSKVNEGTIVIVFSNKFYDENKNYLTNGLVVGEPTAIQKDLAQKLGFRDALIVNTGTYEKRKTDKGYEIQIEVK